ncbi:hypothetical protein PCC8801_2871 [Rippkaea orientalis PCC 8801]|uniref:Uncharacterized protein n=1 Tax=Rippkaea orientalis (strain PCC 8801 / RF-1) TaxID=41431 RepID=B7JV18_RIPO1|nr:hypothetical protein PCC8801_2871 [Rippkaea orientalis PCC 8801]
MDFVTLILLVTSIIGTEHILNDHLKLSTKLFGSSSRKAMKRDCR